MNWGEVGWGQDCFSWLSRTAHPSSLEWGGVAETSGAFPCRRGVPPARNGSTLGCISQT